MKVDFVTCDVFTSRPFAGNPLLVVPDARGLSTAQMQADRARDQLLGVDVRPPARRPPPRLPAEDLRPVQGDPVRRAPDGRDRRRDGGARKDRGRVAKIGSRSRSASALSTLELIREEGSVRRVRMTQGKPAWEAPLRDGASRTRIGRGDRPSGGRSSSETSRCRSSRPETGRSSSRFATSPPFPPPSPTSARSLFSRRNSTFSSPISSPSTGGRIRARAFCPGAGVPEDPATGSAAGPLGIYLALHGALPGGAPRFFIDQGIEMGRPSEIEVTVERGSGRRARPASASPGAPS